MFPQSTSNRLSSLEKPRILYSCSIPDARRKANRFNDSIRFYIEAAYQAFIIVVAVNHHEPPAATCKIDVFKIFRKRRLTNDLPGEYVFNYCCFVLCLRL